MSQNRAPFSFTLKGESHLQNHGFHIEGSISDTHYTARLGVLNFGPIEVPTPVFMPVGTAASIKALTPTDVYNIGYRLILANTYHLFLRPGLDVLAHVNGVQNFMGWPGAVLTDSGGFQVMSLAKIRKINEAGVRFANHINGARIEFTPENVVESQGIIDSDIQMVLDECTSFPASEAEARSSMERSMRWAARAREAHLSLQAQRDESKRRVQFGIVQGGMYPQLRQESATALKHIGFDGYAIGGLSVGESKTELRRVLSSCAQYLPPEKPRYLMGVGSPDDVFDAVLMGIDMFDCVMPTRNARNGSLFVRTSVSPDGKLHIKNNSHRLSKVPIDPNCQCFTCQNFSRAYLRHLFIAQELTVYRLLTLHNLQFMFDFMADIRGALDQETTPYVAAKLKEVRQTYVTLSPHSPTS